MHLLKTLVFIFGTLLLVAAKDDIFTAQVELVALFDTEHVVVKAVERYIEMEEERLSEIKKKLSPFKQKSVEDVVTNPINSFLLIKRLTADLEDLTAIMTEQSNLNGFQFRADMAELRDKFTFPTVQNLMGAVEGLNRLRETYLLDPSKMADGELLGHCCATRLTSADCFEIGHHSYNAGDHEHAFLWMSEALSKLAAAETKEIQPRVSRRVILEYLANSSWQIGNVSAALEYTTQLLTLEPNHPRADANIILYQNVIDNAVKADAGTDDAWEKRSDELKQNYESLCRGERQVIKPEATCRYVSHGNPFYVVGPLREEVMSIRPPIVVYHNVIHESEIEAFKKLAQPRFQRATVERSGELIPAEYRISKSAWIYKTLEVTRVESRISLITGLSLESAEALQVVNYGLAGYYKPHYDFAVDDETFKAFDTGNRIATFLLYLSDVEAGGGTVFPKLQLSIWPRKGSAVFWYNLLEDGTRDYSTLHAACPVIRGSKWVANKWMHERGQEFRKPCKVKISPAVLVPA